MNNLFKIRLISIFLLSSLMAPQAIQQLHSILVHHDDHLHCDAKEVKHLHQAEFECPIHAYEFAVSDTPSQQVSAPAPESFTIARKFDLVDYKIVEVVDCWFNKGPPLG